MGLLKRPLTTTELNYFKPEKSEHMNIFKKLINWLFGKKEAVHPVVTVDKEIDFELSDRPTPTPTPTIKQKPKPKPAPKKKAAVKPAPTRFVKSRTNGKAKK